MVVLEKCVGGADNNCHDDNEINRLFEFPGFNVQIILVTEQYNLDKNDISLSAKVHTLQGDYYNFDMMDVNFKKTII